MNKSQLHLQHLMFLDCCSVNRMDMNHNAMDRSCVYDNWYRSINSPDFEKLFLTAEQRYHKDLTDFKPGFYKDVNDVVRYAREHGQSADEYINFVENGVKTTRPKISTPAAVSDIESLTMLSNFLDTSSKVG